MLPFALLMVCGLYTGTVKLHLTDAHNRPIANHEAWIFPTNSTKPIGASGVQFWIPDEPGTYSGKSNKHGDISIPGVPVDYAMMVVVRFGPRFHKTLDKADMSLSTLDVMKLEGAAYPNKTAHIVIANDYELSGKVTDAGGKPLKDVTVYISDTGFGHMSGYPGTVLDQETTDANGIYRFQKMPNCVFEVMASAQEGTAIESRSGTRAWGFLAVLGQEYRSASARLTKPKTIVDFRISQPAELSVTFKGTISERAGWQSWFQNGSYSSTTGLLLDDATTMTEKTLPGVVTVWIIRGKDLMSIRAAQVRLKSGESKSIEIQMAKALKGKLVDYPFDLR